MHRTFAINRIAAITVLATTFFAASLLAAPAFAASAPASAAPAAVPHDTVDQSVVKKVSDYLNDLTTLKARFVQTANGGKQRGGTLFLDRPGKMRITYDPPDRDFIVADGLFIHYYDAQTKRAGSTLISRSLADFFLRKPLALSGDISVTHAAEEKGTLALTVVQSKNPLAGSLTLIFEDHPLRLEGWRVVDAEGLVTTIGLSDIKTGITFSGDLFHYYDPARETHRFNKN